VTLPAKLRSRTAVVLALAAVGAGVGLGVGLAPAGAEGPPTGPYVALGDSYTAGPLVPDQIVKAGLCLRSNHDYPALVAKALKSKKFVDASCSGATTDDMTHAQEFQAAKPQFAALRRNTALVTVGIGGNDIGFAGIVLTCAGESLLDPAGAPCTHHYTNGGTDQLAAKIRQTAPKIAAVLKGIKTRSPEARIVVVGYPDLLPQSGKGCWPTVPFAGGDLPYLRGVETKLNTMLAEQAAIAGASYVDTYRSSVGHDLCQSSNRKWVEGVIPDKPAAPVHPNAAGMRNDAKQVLAALGK
jgi:lysophospholipase L1-like esterase